MAQKKHWYPLQPLAAPAEPANFSQRSGAEAMSESASHHHGAQEVLVPLAAPAEPPDFSQRSGAEVMSEPPLHYRGAELEAIAVEHEPIRQGEPVPCPALDDEYVSGNGIGHHAARLELIGPLRQIESREPDKSKGDIDLASFCDIFPSRTPKDEGLHLISLPTCVDAHKYYTESSKPKRWLPFRMKRHLCRNMCPCDFCCFVYLFLFLAFLASFPLFLKFLTTAPMPRAYWHGLYDDFPILDDWDFVRQNEGRNYSVKLSKIPTTHNGCNYSCGSPNMDFNVEAELHAKGFKHTVYPVLLASTDFKKWWVAADRRHAKPQKFFASNEVGRGSAHRLVTEKCSRNINPTKDQKADPSASPTYLLACVTWTLAKIRKLSNRTDKYGDLPDLEHHSIIDHCDVVGGTCGWGSKGQVSKCSQEGTLDISEMFPNSSFRKGSISVRPCKTPQARQGSDSCITSDLHMSQWQSHECVNQTRDTDQLRARDDILSKIIALQEEKIAKQKEVAIGGPQHAIKQNEREVKQIDERIEAFQNLMSHYAETPKLAHVYSSLPQLEVVLQDFHPDDLVGMTSPHAFVLTSSKPDGPWHHAYHDFYSYPLPIPVQMQDIEIPQYADRNSMQFIQRNKLTLEPRKCFAKRGPLYLVICAVNESTHVDNFEMDEYAKVAPPPFNDRCLAVQGRCAYACMEEQSELKHCNATSGKIYQNDLVEDLDSRTNQSLILHWYVFVLMVGFVCKVLSLVPGIIWGYAHAESACRKEQTDKLKYIAVCTPSGGESKACVLRNLVGAISCIPTECSCLYHVAFTDEGHRHAHKEMFHVLNIIVRLVEKRDELLEAKGLPPRIFSSFMQKWVECTKLTSLKSCNDSKFKELDMYDEMLRRFSGENAFKHIIDEGRFRYKFKDFENQFKKMGAEVSNAVGAHSELPDFTIPEHLKSRHALPTDGEGSWKLSKAWADPLDYEAEPEADQINCLLYKEIQVMKEVLKAGQDPLQSRDEIEKALKEITKSHADDTNESDESRNFELLVTVDGMEDQKPHMVRVENVKSCNELKGVLKEKLKLKCPVESLSYEDKRLNKQVIHHNIKSMPFGKCSVQVQLANPCQLERYALSLRWASSRKEEVKRRGEHQDDLASYTNFSASNLRLHNVCLHYLARAKPKEDEFTIKTRHVNKGVCYYRVREPEVDPGQVREKLFSLPGQWLSFRSNIDKGVREVRGNQTKDDPSYDVPVRTSRGKAGGLNFTENYFWLFHEDEVGSWVVNDQGRVLWAREGMRSELKRSEEPVLFSIADARHQFQPNFFHITVPFFFKDDGRLCERVGFTQCPQYFPENQDEFDYLDTNNANFYRFSCMIRDCVGGVSSCGTNGTWLLMPRKVKSIWDFNSYDGWVEQQVFNECCKIEDTASSLESVLKGQHSLYINMRLSVGVAKEALDYLAAIQRWSEGAVVLFHQTFWTALNCFRHDNLRAVMIWVALLLWISFLASVYHLVFTEMPSYYIGVMGSLYDEPELWEEWGQKWASEFIEQASVVLGKLGIVINEWEIDHYVHVVYSFQNWVCVLLISVTFVWVVTAVSWCKNMCCPGSWRFPTNISHWLRLFISVENLTYFFWFWTAFFWVIFNYYSVFTKRDFAFDPKIMLGCSIVLNVIMWSIVIASCFRFFGKESGVFNQKWELTLTNIWRTTQLYYITAPLQAYSLFKGTQDFWSWLRYNEDISGWAGADRGKISKDLVKYWSTLLVLGVPTAWICIATGVAAEAKDSVPAAFVCTFIGLDALHPCAFLWLDVKREPERITVKNPVLRFCWKLCNPAWYRNRLRDCIFSPFLNGLLQWSGPFQNIFLAVGSYFFPQLGLTAALNLVVQF